MQNCSRYGILVNDSSRANVIRENNLIENQMNIETGRNPEKNKNELAMNYFRLALMKKGTFRDYFIDRAFSTLEIEWTIELEEKYLKKAEETEIIEEKR